MPGRKPSARLRFEVFKRDSFTCQYCGRKAPDVILHCDHIHPVAKGGKTDILNLLTSCRECNGGKGPVLLSKQIALGKQRQTLEELQQRREQLEMMVRWRDELAVLEDDKVAAIVQRIVTKTSGQWTVNGHGKANLRRWLGRFGVDEILAAVDASFAAYLKFVGDEPDEESWNIAFRKVPIFISIARAEHEQPNIRRLLYIQGIIRRREGSRVDCLWYLKHLASLGTNIDEMESRAKRMSPEDFKTFYDAWLLQIGASLDDPEEASS